MELALILFLSIIVLAFISEYIDAAMGMGYGTILSPILIIMGFNPLVSVPAILLSQALGGFSASVFHHKFKNASFKTNSKDMKIALVIIFSGISATILATCIAISIPSIVVKTYIGSLVVLVGCVLIFNITSMFSWKKIVALSILSAFNKGISGGGFGPILTGGQIIAGQDHKNAVAVTTLAEAPICIISFLTYLIANANASLSTSIFKSSFNELLAKLFSPQVFHLELTLALIIGAILGAPLGALLTKKLKKHLMKRILGFLILLLGIWSLYKTYF